MEPLELLLETEQSASASEATNSLERSDRMKS
jgi:hypothetical protein